MATRSHGTSPTTMMTPTMANLALGRVVVERLKKGRPRLPSATYDVAA